MKRYFIYLGYNGAKYCGWQVQPNGITVQQVLEEALATLLRSAVPVVGAGRTDTGVHARMMVAHFDREEAVGGLPLLAGKLNRLLPKDIAIDRIVEVNEEAHARFSAVSRTYHYYVATQKSPFNYDSACRLYFQPDFGAMNEACRLLLEHTDFTSFSKLHTDVKTNNCRISSAEWTDEGGGVWKFSVTADRFLRNMVRAIVGTLLEVGRGKLSADGFRQVIEAKDRGQAGTSAPAHALFLEDIRYPEEVFQLKNAD
ncbi:tRNA pseudouridine synthase A [Bacteroidia bacterium]|nr:tRNA pseudouridine synthase A [Bacteroidia bacterium]